MTEVIRMPGITTHSFNRWKAKHTSLEVDQVRLMAQLQEDNLLLKRLVAELTLLKTMLQHGKHRDWCSR